MFSLVCYNFKATNIYNFSFNQNQNFIKEKTPLMIFKRYRNKNS